MLFKQHFLNCLNFFLVKCSLQPLEQDCIGPRLHKPLTLNIFLMQSCLEPLKQHCIGFQLSSVVPRVLRQNYTGLFLCNVVWGLSNNIAQGFYLCNGVPRVLRQNYTGLFYAMLSEAFQTTLHRVFSCAMSQEF